MNEHTETTAENLRFLRGAKGLNQADVGELIGIDGNHVSNIETGRRALAPSEKKLLDLYFFGVMPEGLVRAATDTRASLDLTEDEWRIIQILAARAGQTAEDWIRQRIQDYLGYLEATQPPAENIEPFPKAAEDPGTFKKSPPADGKPNADTTPPPPTDEEKGTG